MGGGSAAPQSLNAGKHRRPHGDIGWKSAFRTVLPVRRKSARIASVRGTMIPLSTSHGFGTWRDARKGRTLPAGGELFRGRFGSAARWSRSGLTSRESSRSGWQAKRPDGISRAPVSASIQTKPARRRRTGVGRRSGAGGVTGWAVLNRLPAVRQLCGSPW